MNSHWLNPISEEAQRNNIIGELILTERKYVQDLELLQTYATAVSESALLSAHALHLLFSNLSQLLDFQRKFLSRLEVINLLPWQDQRWGRHFIEIEEEFATAYEPWTINWSKNGLTNYGLPSAHRNPPVSNRILQLRDRLAVFDSMVDLTTEFPVFMVRPVSRAYKYPLLMDSLLKAAAPDTYPHYNELQRGLHSAKRVANSVETAHRLVENVQTIEELSVCVSDMT
ncbi:Dbl homology domain-containing protein [Mycena sanguinolenta]|nr:Dbl homology domain-containing protein [Mycena sanguinolenta]